MYTSFHQEVCEAVNEILWENNISEESFISIADIMPITEKAAKVTEIKKDTSRKTTVYVENVKNDTDETDKGFYVRSKMLFKLENSLEIGNSTTINSTILSKINSMVDSNGNPVTSNEAGIDVDSMKTEISEEVTDLWNAATTSTNLQLEYNVYYNTVPFDVLENIYMMYSPLSDLAGQKWKSDTVYVDMQDAGDVYGNSHKLNFYLVPQLGLAALNSDSDIISTNYIKPKVTGGRIVTTEADEATDTSGSAIGSGTGSGGTVVVPDTGENTTVTETMLEYNKIQLNYMENYIDKGDTFSALDAKDSIVSHMDSENVLYTVTIRVFKHADSDSDRFADDNYLTELSIAGI